MKAYIVQIAVECPHNAITKEEIHNALCQWIHEGDDAPLINMAAEIVDISYPADVEYHEESYFDPTTGALKE
jgi:hypothetical protein